MRNLSYDLLIEWLNSNALSDSGYIDTKSIHVYETRSKLQNDEDVEKGKDITKLLFWSTPIARDAQEKSASCRPVHHEEQETEVASTIPSTRVQDASISFPGSISPSVLEGLSHVLLACRLSEAQRELQRALKAYEDGRMPDCCHNLRKGLEIVWLRVYEMLENEDVPRKPGTAQDIGPLVNSLRRHGAQDDAVGIVRSVWAYITERDHIEKRAGQAPSENETILGIQLVFSAVKYLLTFAS